MKQKANTYVMDLLYSLAQANIGDITDKKNSESVGYTQDILWDFIQKTIEYLHEGGSNKDFKSKINSLELKDLNDGNAPSKQQSDANKHGFHLIKSHLESEYKDLEKYPVNHSRRNLLHLLQWLVTKHSKFDIVAEAQSLLTRIFPRAMKAEELHHESVVARFDYMFSIAYGNDDDWRYKCALWKKNFAKSEAALTSEHRLLLANIEKTVEEKIEIIDGTREAIGEDSESARKAIKDAWNDTYKEARSDLARINNLFINKVKEDKSSLGNRKRKDSPSNNNISSLRRPEKKSKAQDKKGPKCDMCSLKGRSRGHPTNECRTSNHTLFDGTIESIVDYTDRKSVV